MLFLLLPTSLHGALRRPLPRLAMAALLLGPLLGAAATPSRQQEARTPASAQAAQHRHAGARHRKPHEHAQVGKASVYSHRFAGKPMADGEPMDPHDDNAASKTLPLGTRARVTNLENGHSATVTIEDRGPFVKGRVIDVSPATARRLGISREEGVATVRVVPLALPDELASGDAASRREGADVDALR